MKPLLNMTEDEFWFWAIVIFIFGCSIAYTIHTDATINQPSAKYSTQR